MNYFALVIPVFVSFVLLEYFISTKQRKKCFKFSETISNINVGIFERICDLFTTSVFHFFFSWLYDHYAIFQIEQNFLSWIALFLVTDFIWYWYHRLGHKANLLLSAHIVHHQSEDFNFSVAARITIFQAFFRSLFWSVIPVLGFEPEMITLILLIHGIYPFFLDTQTIGNMGWFETVFVTPSHHRVHHSSNPEYIDRNFGDVLIIWDKLFRTFTAEQRDKPITYGITHPVKSYSFLWQHFHYLISILIAFKRTRGFRAKWAVIFGKPENFDHGIITELESRLLTHSSSSLLPSVLIRYTTINLIFVLTFTFFFLLLAPAMNLWQLGLGGTFIFFSLVHSGAILEQKKWLFLTEFIRVNLLLCFITSITFSLSFMLLPVLFALIALTFYENLNQSYLRLLTIPQR